MKNKAILLIIALIVFFIITSLVHYAKQAYGPSIIRVGMDIQEAERILKNFDAVTSLGGSEDGINLYLVPDVPDLLLITIDESTNKITHLGTSFMADTGHVTAYKKFEEIDLRGEKDEE